MEKKLNLSRVIAHRGASGYAPENTLAAMQEAYELGSIWVEFDVMLTRDQHAIIIHDETLERTANERKAVAECDLSIIKKLDAGSWFSSQYSDQTIPTFSEMLAFLAQYSMQMNIEIKPTLGREVLTARQTIVDLKKYWLFTQSIPLISSAKEASLQTVYQMDSLLPLGFISDDWIDNWHNKLQSLHCVSWHINHQALTAEKVAAVKAANYYLLAYTVNDPVRAEQLFAWGVDAVFSDYPDLILHLEK